MPTFVTDSIVCLSPVSVIKANFIEVTVAILAIRLAFRYRPAEGAVWGLDSRLQTMELLMEGILRKLMNTLTRKTKSCVGHLYST